jgi:peptidoglycan/LPS O-acetylase OafA/YrhL
VELKRLIKDKNINYQIQILRGLTVTAVILFHFSHKMFPNGYLGVDIFFIISGYVIAPSIERLYKEADKSLRKLIANSFQFIVARFERLMPTLALVVMITAVIGVFVLPIGVSQENLFNQGVASISLLANVGAYKTHGDYFAPTQLPLLHIWSLSAEQQIYIFLPLLLIVLSLFAFSIDSKTFFTYLYATLFLISVFVFLILNYAVTQNLLTGIPLLGSWIYYSPTTRIIEFLFGAILSRLSLGTLPFQVTRIAYLGICIVMFAPRQFLGFELSLVLVLTLLLCVVLLCSTSTKSNSKPSSLFIYLGDRSYSLYLWHLPVIIYANEISKFFEVSNLLITLTSICLIISFAHISHAFIEIRARQHLKNFARRKSLFTLIFFSFFTPFFLLISLQWLNQNNYFKEQKQVVEYASTLDKKCERDGTDTLQPCNYNPGNSRSLLLIGDSHAGAISQVVIDASRRLGYSTYIWTQGGCALLDPYSSADVFKEFSSFPSACQRHNNRILDFVKRTNPDLIIATQRSERITSNGSISSDFQVSFEKYLRLLRTNSNQVLYIGPTPEFPESLYTDYVLQSRKEMKSFKSRMNQSSFIENEIYKGISAEVGVNYFDPIPMYCNSVLCEYKDKRGEFFTDGSHLSVYGASKLLKPLELAIKSG